MIEQESIACAAIRVLTSQGSYKIYTAPRPGRHRQVLDVMLNQGEKTLHPPDAEQGFLTNDGSFVSRWRAHKIAYAAGQTARKPNWDSELFSEDVW